MKLTWVGHACFKLEEQGYAILFDPYKDDVVPGLKPVREKVNLVLSSHDHRDHNGLEVVEIAEGGTNPFSVTKIANYHDDKEGTLRGNNIIHLLENDAIRVAHFGDTGCDLTKDQIEMLKGLDVAMMPVGGTYTVDAQMAKKIVDEIGPKVIIPMHYRGDSFGYDVIDTVDTFAGLFDHVTKVEGSVLEIDADTQGVVILVPQNI